MLYALWENAVNPYIAPIPPIPPVQEFRGAAGWAGCTGAVVVNDDGGWAGTVTKARQQTCAFMSDTPRDSQAILQWAFCWAEMPVRMFFCGRRAT